MYSTKRRIIDEPVYITSVKRSRNESKHDKEYRKKESKGERRYQRDESEHDSANDVEVSIRKDRTTYTESDCRNMLRKDAKQSVKNYEIKLETETSIWHHSTVKSEDDGNWRTVKYVDCNKNKKFSFGDEDNKYVSKCGATYFKTYNEYEPLVIKCGTPYYSDTPERVVKLCKSHEKTPERIVRYVGDQKRMSSQLPIKWNMRGIEPYRSLMG